MLDKLDPYLRDDIDEAELNRILEDLLKNRAFEMAGVFLAQLLSHLQGSHFGTAIVQTLGLDHENSKVAQLAEQHGIARQTYFDTRQRLEAILSKCQFPRLKARRKPIASPPGFYSATEIRKKFDLGFDKIRETLATHQVPIHVHQLKKFYPAATVDQLYASGEFDRLTVRKRAERSKRHTRDGWVRLAVRQRSARRAKRQTRRRSK